MKIDKLKEIFEDESLKYALATNIAKYGRPQSKKSDKKAKLTKGLEKKREKAVKDLKKSMGEQDMGSRFPGPEIGNKGYKMAREIIAKLRREVYPKFNDDELEEFRNEMKDHLGLYLKENKDTGVGLDRIKFYFDKLYGPDLRFNINRDPNNPERDRIDVRGSQQDLADFGRALQGQEMEGYEIFWTEDDDRGNIVRIVKSDSINEKKKKGGDRCLRIARRKMPKTSAYRSGLIVKCRKGMIWKKEK
jgi:hypothetical protein